jgi:HK97 family phage portal protein
MTSSALAVIPRDWSTPSLEVRSSLENPQTPLSYPAEWLLDIFSGGRTDSGIRVSERIAFQVSTFLACVDLIAGKISSLPFHLQERRFSNNGRAIHSVAYDHEYYDLLYMEPNEEMTSQTLLKAFLCHCLAWSNGYIELQRDYGNAVVGLWPRNPATTRPKRLISPVRLDPVSWRPFPVSLPAGRLVFVTSDGMDDADNSGSERIIPLEDMLHVPGLSFDGRLGQSVVYLARNLLGLALATEKFGAKYFANYARPGGILKIPMNLDAQAREKAKQSWKEAQGGENSNGVAVMPPGFEWQSITNNAQEAQTTETRAYLRNEIAALMHVPPRMVGDTSKSSRATTEQENQELLDFTLSPWMNAIKLEWKRKLFPHTGIGRTPRNRFFVEFDVSGLVRGDAAAREKFNASGKQWGYLNTNDIRAIEGLPPIEEPWAEEYWMPINMTLATTPIDPTHQDGAGNGTKPPEEPIAQAFSRVFRDRCMWIAGRETRDHKAIRGAFGPILFSLRDMLIADAARELRSEATVAPDSDRFIVEYLGAMQPRAAAWSAETALANADQELLRAIRAIRVAVYREVATAKAKEGESNEIDS